MNTARLERWGLWLKARRPRVSIERIDADSTTRYIESFSRFKSKATVYGTLSTMRGFGDYLVRQGLWTKHRCDGVRREAPGIALDLLVEVFGGHPIESGEFGIEHAMTT